MKPTQKKPKETHIQRNYTQTSENKEEKKKWQISLRKLWRLSGRGTALKNKCQPTILYPVRPAFGNKKEIKTFLFEEKLRKYVASRPALK